MNKYQSFINRMYPLLIDYGRKNNLPNHLVDHMMKQLAYESNYGNSALARTHHNYGGYGYTGNGKYRNYKTDQDFINDYGSWFLRRRDVQNAKNINDYAKALKKYGYYEDSYDHYSSQLRNMRTLEKYMRDYNLNNIRKSSTHLDQSIQQRLQQKPDATFVEPNPSTSAILTPADIITQRQKFNQFVQPNTFDNLRGQLMQNLNQLQYSTPQEYMQNIYQYDKGKDFGGYVDALESAANKIQNSDYAWRDENGEKLSIDRMLLQMMNDNTYKYKDAYDNHNLIDPSGNMHFSDKYKTAYHPTFSNESIFSGKKSENNPEGIIGGMWSKDWSKYYVGDRVNSMYFNPIRTMQYLKQAEDHPVKLIYGSGIRDTIRAKRLKNHKVFGYDYGKSIPMFDDGSDNNFFGDVVEKLGGGRNAQEIGNFVGQMIPGYGAYLDIKDAINDPSLSNIALAALNMSADIATFGAASAGIKAAIKAAKLAKQISNERKAAATAALITGAGRGVIPRGRARRLDTRLNNQKNLVRKSAIDVANPFDRIDDTVSTLHDAKQSAQKIYNNKYNATKRTKQ